MNTDEYKEKIRQSKLGEKNWIYGKTQSDEVKKILSEKMKLEMKNPEVIQKLKNRKWTEEQKIKHKNAINNPDHLKMLRERRLKQMEKSGQFPGYNENACKFFDILNKKLKLNGVHALNSGEKQICGYSVDFYDEEKNIIIEWDEKKHDEPKQKEKDIIRQNNILKEIKCKFYRINEKTRKIYKINQNKNDHITNQIQDILNEQN